MLVQLQTKKRVIQIESKGISTILVGILYLYKYLKPQRVVMRLKDRRTKPAFLISTRSFHLINSSFSCIFMINWVVSFICLACCVYVVIWGYSYYYILKHARNTAIETEYRTGLIYVYAKSNKDNNFPKLGTPNPVVGSHPGVAFQCAPGITPA
jgi:hypothetical protein